MNGPKPIQTIFFLNAESWTMSARPQNPTKISIGTSVIFSTNPVCATDITDTGWYECPTSLTGGYISV